MSTNLILQKVTEMDQSLRACIESVLGSEITSARSVSGGSIATSYRVTTPEGSYFLKTGDGSVAETFAPEAKGLAEIAAAESTLRVLKPLAVQRPDEGPAFLLLDWIEEGKKTDGFWNDLGHGLARLHAFESDMYGFEVDNFIGRLPQKNREHSDWPTFFWENRLHPQISWAKKKGRWQSQWDAPAGNLQKALSSILPATPKASLLHGDLWGGNIMADELSRPVLIDPAVYYGHSETDLAFTQLFGGFDRRFYEAYQQVNPLVSGYDERRGIYNLYHLINHLNHFGQSYARQVDRILSHY